MKRYQFVTNKKYQIRWRLIAARLATVKVLCVNIYNVKWCECVKRSLFQKMNVSIGSLAANDVNFISFFFFVFVYFGLVSVFLVLWMEKQDKEALIK